jgi:hypothetical protein
MGNLSQSCDHLLAKPSTQSYTDRPSLPGRFLALTHSVDVFVEGQVWK